MVYKFSGRSANNLKQVDNRLVELCNKVLELGLFDFGISCGYRSEEEQEKLFFEGKTKVKFPNSKHNSYPSKAVDFVLYVNDKVDYNNLPSWYMACGVFRGVAASMGLKIRVGADWDSDFSVKDQNFHDLPHIELVE